MKIGVKYNKDYCGGTLYFEDDLGHTSQEQFRCGADGHIGETKHALPEPVAFALERACWNNCRPARWRRAGRRSSGAWGGSRSGCGCGRRR